jgi:hypothetical protein
MDGISVHKCRQRMCIALAKTCLRKLSKQADEIDAVVPSVEVAKALGKPLSLGLVKNRYSSRSFILPNQGQRSKAVQRKISAVEEEMHGKRVLIVDDSIVRGNTSREIVALARKAGAVKVIYASASPAIRYVLVVDDLNAEDDTLTGGQIQPYPWHRPGGSRSPSSAWPQRGGSGDSHWGRCSSLSFIERFDRMLPGGEKEHGRAAL